MVGNFAQIYSPYLYEKESGPRYLPAMTANSKSSKPLSPILKPCTNQNFVTAIFVFVSIMLATLLRFCLVRENKKLERAEIEQHEIQMGEKGNVDHMEVSHASPAPGLSPGFRFLL
jgi:hypothetical protein